MGVCLSPNRRHMHMIHSAKQIYRIFGLRRSGNHVFIKWLLSQTTASFCFFNNANLDNLFHRKPDESNASCRDADALIFSFEDRDLDLAMKPEWLTHNGISEVRCIDIIMARDPLDLFASRLKGGMRAPLFFTGLTIPLLYDQYLEKIAAIGPGNDENNSNNRLAVLFEPFLESAAYREQLRIQLQLGGGVEKMETVDTRYGGGSSFRRGSKKPPTVDELKNRWKGAKGDPVFRHWVASLNRVDLYGQIFNPHPERLRFIQDIKTSKSLPLKAFKFAQSRVINQGVRFLRASGAVRCLRDCVDPTRRAYLTGIPSSQNEPIHPTYGETG